MMIVFEARKKAHEKKTVVPFHLPPVKVGQIGFIKHERSKHSVRPAYFVTKVDDDKQLITAKKMLHVHSRIPTRFQNANYEIKMSDFILAKSSIIPVTNRHFACSNLCLHETDRKTYYQSISPES